jgi:hypothetical protein
MRAGQLISPTLFTFRQRSAFADGHSASDRTHEVVSSARRVAISRALTHCAEVATTTLTRGIPSTFARLEGAGQRLLPPNGRQRMTLLRICQDRSIRNFYYIYRALESIDGNNNDSP